MQTQPQSEALRKESLKEDSFSSNAHAIELFTDESLHNLDAVDFPIPTRYGRDVLTVMASNVQTLFIYWELTASLLQNFSSLIDKNSDEYRIRVYEEGNGHANKQLADFAIRGDFGDYYLNIHLPRKKVFCSIGFVDEDGKFIEFLRSKTISMPSDMLTLDGSEVWMRKKEDWMQILRSSMHPMALPESSLSLVREMEFLRKFQVVAMQAASSLEFVKNDQNRKDQK